MFSVLFDVLTVIAQCFDWKTGRMFGETVKEAQPAILVEVFLILWLFCLIEKKKLGKNSLRHVSYSVVLI